MVRPVLEELIKNIAVGGVKLDAIETGFLREYRAVMELLDDALNFMQLERARHFEFRFNDVVVLIADSRILERAQCRRSNRRDAACICRMCLAPCMPHLQEDAPALGVDRVNHSLPTSC